MEQKKVIVIYEIEQIAEVQSYIEREKISLDTCIIVPLEFHVERALTEKNIPCRSLVEFVSLEEEFGGELQAARACARQFHEHRAMQFYTYQGINLGEVFEPMIDLYLEHLSRYAAILKRIVEGSEADVLYIPYTTHTLHQSLGPLVSFWFLAPTDAAVAVGASVGVDTKCIGAPPATAQRSHTSPLLVFSLALYNGCMSLLPSRPLKLFASEYWSHIESFIEKMDDVELVLMERNEIKKIPWRQLFKHRIRFLHPHDKIDKKTRRTITATAKAFSVQWQAAKHEVREIFSLVPDVDIWAPLERALSDLVEMDTPQALADIEGLRCILQQERPNKVLLRASIGGLAPHFFITTQIAHQLGIPSIELQHAGAVVDPRSMLSRLTASYLASYGPLMREIYQKNHTYAGERIRDIGSPRFDHYVHERDVLEHDREGTVKSLGLDPQRPVMFAAVPFASAWMLALSTYQLAEYFKVLRAVQKEIPQLQIIFKFRPNELTELYRNYIEEIFTDGGVALTSTTNFLPLIVASDVACTGNSTLIYEIMLGGRPMVLFPWQKWDTYTLALYQRAAPVAWSASELCTLLRRLSDKDEAAKALQRQHTFLAEGCSFDGHAPERMMTLLREKLLPLP